MQYRAPRWLPGGHAQTIWSSLYARNHRGALPWRRERLDTPDGDFIDIDWLDAAAPGAASDSAISIAISSAIGGTSAAATETPLLVLFHGLEGSSGSHSSRAFASIARERGWRFALPHFRGCSGELNRAPRAYHSGDFEEIGWMLEQLRTRHTGPIIAAGVSLGGNALMRWAEESGAQARETVRAVASVCSPIDLTACGLAIGRGFNRLVYTRMFLSTMVPKALRKLAQHPGLFDGERLASVRTIEAFDDCFTAPLHGFTGVRDYWTRAAAKPHLHRIEVPALVLNARNDPFVPATSLPHQQDVGPYVTLWQPPAGGHVGFPRGRLPPGEVFAMPEQVCGWLAQSL